MGNCKYPFDSRYCCRGGPISGLIATSSRGRGGLGAACLASALGSHWRMRRLDLSNNPIGGRTSPALLAILRALRDARHGHKVEVLLTGCSLASTSLSGPAGRGGGAAGVGASAWRLDAAEPEGSPPPDVIPPSTTAEGLLGGSQLLTSWFFVQCRSDSASLLPLRPLLARAFLWMLGRYSFFDSSLL